MRRLALALLAVIALGCSDATAPDHSGFYDLLSINGLEIPITTQDEPNFREVITSGSIVLDRDGTFEDRLEWSQWDGETTMQFGDTIVGTWSVRGQNVTMTYQDGGTIVGELENGRLTQEVQTEFQTVVFIYQR